MLHNTGLQSGATWRNVSLLENLQIEIGSPLQIFNYKELVIFADKWVYGHVRCEVDFRFSVSLILGVMGEGVSGEGFGAGGW